MKALSQQMFVNESVRKSSSAKRRLENADASNEYLYSIL